MGAHARPSSSPSGRFRNGLLALAVVVALAAGIWVLRSVGTPETTTSSTLPATIAPTSTTSSTTSTTEPIPEFAYGGEAVVGITADPVMLNPFLEGGASDVVQLVGRPVWVGAFGLDGVTLDPRPVLAAEIPTFSNGGLVARQDGTVSVTVGIRPGAVWEDGSAITGGDFAFTYALATDPSVPIRTDLRALYEQIVPGSLSGAGSTVTYDLVEPSLAYLDLFSILVPASQVEGTNFATDWNDRLWMSAGPFRFEEWRQGESISLSRNDDYWETDPLTGQALPYLDRLVFQVGGNANGLVTGFEAREFDIIAVPPESAAVRNLQALDGTDVQLRVGPSWEHLSFQFGPGRFERNPNSVNEHLEFRRAVAQAIDRSSIAETIYQGLIPALDSPIGIAWPAAASDGWSGYDGDTAGAAAALEDLAATTEITVLGAVLTINNAPERVEAAAEIEEMLGEADIELTVEPPESTGVYFLETVGPGSFDLAQWAWVPGAGPSAIVADLQRWFVVSPESDGANFSRWPVSDDDPRVVQLQGLFEEMTTEMDLERLKLLLGEAEQLMAELVVTVPLYAELNAGAVWADEIEGFAHSIIPGGDTWNAAGWHRIDG